MCEVLCQDLCQVLDHVGEQERHVPNLVQLKSQWEGQAQMYRNTVTRELQAVAINGNEENEDKTLHYRVNDRLFEEIAYKGDQGRRGIKQGQMCTRMFQTQEMAKA